MFRSFFKGKATEPVPEPEPQLEPECESQSSMLSGGSTATTSNERSERSAQLDAEAALLEEMNSLLVIKNLDTGQHEEIIGGTEATKDEPEEKEAEDNNNTTLMIQSPVLLQAEPPKAANTEPLAREPQPITAPDDRGCRETQINNHHHEQEQEQEQEQDLYDPKDLHESALPSNSPLDPIYEHSIVVEPLSSSSSPSPELEPTVPLPQPELDQHQSKEPLSPIPSLDSVSTTSSPASLAAPASPSTPSASISTATSPASSRPSSYIPSTTSSLPQQSALLTPTSTPTPTPSPARREIVRSREHLEAYRSKQAQKALEASRRVLTGSNNPDSSTPTPGQEKTATAAAANRGEDEDDLDYYASPSFARRRRGRAASSAAARHRSSTVSSTTSSRTSRSSSNASTSTAASSVIAPSTASALAAVEPHHEQPLLKMAFAEQQKWITVQQKTFTKWLNTKIAARSLEVQDLVKDLSDGVILIHLLECLSGETLGRYSAKPKLRVQRFENANLSLDYIRSRGIQMTNIGAEDVVDGNQKLILGLIWTLILRFTISDINEEGMTAKEGLLLWCQRKTACYDEVEVRDFSTSWNDGLAFCALLDIHRPDLIDYDALDKSDHRGNMQLAFDIATKEIGIPDLLDVEDVCDVAKPDEKSLMTYIAYWFHAFSQMEKVENAGRRVEKFINNMQGAWEMQSAYERRMRALLKAIEEQQLEWKEAKFEGTYIDAKNQAMEFTRYKKGKKREWVAEKSDLAALLGNIKTKLLTYRLRPYEPPQELRLEVLDKEWSNLMKNEMARGQLINETIRDIKNALRRSFADKANDFAMALHTMQLAISGLEGEVEDQLVHVKRLNDNLPPLDAYLEKIAVVDKQCEEANIEENDFTTYTYDELCYELGLVKSSVAKKLAFLDNQVVARNMTNLTPIQLEEFESVFRHFDRDGSNNLHELEFSAALASLGLVFSEDEMHDYFLETSDGRDYVSFEQFIRFMVDVTEDQNTAEQVLQSFREVADGKPYVTEIDLRHSLVPDEVIDKLVQFCPPHKGPDLQEDRGLAQYDYISFMNGMINDAEDSTSERAVLADVPNGRSQGRANSPSKVNGYH